MRGIFERNVKATNCGGVLPNTIEQWGRKRWEPTLIEIKCSISTLSTGAANESGADASNDL